MLAQLKELGIAEEKGTVLAVAQDETALQAAEDIVDIVRHHNRMSGRAKARIGPVRFASKSRWFSWLRPKAKGTVPGATNARFLARLRSKDPPPPEIARAARRRDQGEFAE